MTIARRISALALAACMFAGGAVASAADAESGLVVSPALERATQEDVLGRVWQGGQLSVRDRGLATVAALVARGQTASLGGYVEVALDNGVEPAEISEVIYHLAYYAGWQNAVEAAAVVAPIFEARGITQDAMPLAAPEELLPLDEESEASRARMVQQNYGEVSQGVVDDTTRLLFRDLWLRPALAPRDRSMITVAALVAAGHTEQIGFHLSRAMDNGLTKDEASALLHHLAFYAGWPNVFSAMPVAKQVFERRAEP